MKEGIRSPLFVAATALSLAIMTACGSGGDPSSSSSGTGASGGSGGAGGAPPADPLAKLAGYLRGDFDNKAQHDMGFGKLVERHVCNVPGRDADPQVVWVYVEQVDDTTGQRDAYYTRINEIRVVNGNPVARIYKFVDTHPLATDPFSFNGTRDGCEQPDVLQAIMDSDLIYRDGCDVTFVEDGDLFHASTTGTSCTFPGGYIQTKAEVFADGMDNTDTAVAGGQMIGEEFNFRRVMP